jgi:hypothetical protein
MTTWLRTVAALMALGACALAHSQESVRSGGQAVQTPSAETPGQGTGGEFTSLLDMKLGVATLTQVEQRLAPAKLSHSRASGTYIASLCYRGKSASVQFMSGEDGGDNLRLLAFALRPPNALQGCAKLPAKIAAQKLRIGPLKLGMSKAQFAASVGAEVAWQDNMGQVSFQDKRMLTDAEISKYPPVTQVAIASGRTKNYFDVSIALIGTFAGDKLVSIEVWQTESL